MPASRQWQAGMPASRYGLAVRWVPRPWDGVGAFGPAIPGGDHVLDAVRLHASEVVHFGAVALHVVKLPRAIRAFRDELPVTDAERPISLVLPEQCVALDGLAGKRGQEAA